MADVRKGSAGAVVAWVIGALIVGFVLAQIKGTRDGCEAGGGTTRGLECVKPEGGHK